jgi:hypothetical protein
VYALGLGSWIDKKIAEQKTKSLEQRERQKKLNTELEDIRWKSHVSREKKQAALESPSRAGRIINTLGAVGERSNAASKGFTGGVTIDPTGGFGSFGFGGGKGGDMGFEVKDPLSFGGGSSFKPHKRKHHQDSREIHVHVHTERERGRHRRR